MPRAARLVFCCLIASSMLSACATAVDGSAQPAADLGTSAPAVSTTAPVVVPATGVEANLLTRSELAAVVGDTDLSEVRSFTSPDPTTRGFDPRACGHRALVATALGYANEGRRAVFGNTNRGIKGRTAAQLISVWENHHQPRDVLESARRGWALCGEGEQFTVEVSDGGADEYWVAGQITAVNESRASTVVQRLQPPGQTCDHIFAIQANIAVESVACSEGDTAAQAKEITDRILARFPG